MFPEDGLVKIGTVSAYMAGLWTIPIFIIVYCASRIGARFSDTAGYFAAGAVAAALFVGSEQTLWVLSSWYARNVKMVGHVALYIVIPEILLGAVAFYAYRVTVDKSIAIKLIGAFLTMQVYLGSAAFFYLLVEWV